jgi:hypothetical protein
VIDLHLGDCGPGLAALGDDAVDHVITDPPFDARTHAAARFDSRRPRDEHWRPLDFAPLDDARIAELAFQLARVTRRWIVVFTAERQLETWAVALETAGARVLRFGLARRTNPKPQLTGDRPAVPGDPIVIAHARSVHRMRWNGGGKAAVWNAPPVRLDEGGQVHHAQKPLELMRALVEDFTDRGELVLDPFAGSGTTALACKVTGRRFVGWELDPGYHTAALRRLEGAREQLALGGCR